MTVQPAKSVPPADAHPLSFHPKVRAVLEAGLEKEWTTKEVASLLGLTVRATQMLFAAGFIKAHSFPTTEGAAHGRVYGAALLTYLLERLGPALHELDLLRALAPLLPQISDTGLLMIQDAAGRVMRRREHQPVIIADPARSMQRPAARLSVRPAADARQLELFPAPPPTEGAA